MLYLDSASNRPHPRELLLDTILNGEIDRLGESLYHIFPQIPHVSLAFAHLRLLSLRLPGFPDSIASERLDLADSIADQLRSSSPPLNHHFAGLSAITFAENMVDDQSVASLRRLQAGLDTSKTLWNAAISSFINKKLGDGASGSANDTGSSRGGLQHLADAAVGNDTNGGVADWTAVGVKGFLTMFE